MVRIESGPVKFRSRAVVYCAKSSFDALLGCVYVYMLGTDYTKLELLGCRH